MDDGLVVVKPLQRDIRQAELVAFSNWFCRRVVVDMGIFIVANVVHIVLILVLESALVIVLPLR